MLQPFEYRAKTKIIFGENSLAQLGNLANDLGCKRALIVADPGIIATGHVEKANAYLTDKGIQTNTFSDFAANPTSENVIAGVKSAQTQNIDIIIGLGGGSSMDCAKGINFVLTNGGKISDYWGYGKASKDMLPMIGIPTTTGTGSEAQCYALISDSTSHRKMACGDPKAAFCIAILDPCLATTQPISVIRATGIDAISHAIESAVTTRKNAISFSFSLYSWKLLHENFEKIIEQPSHLEFNSGMQIGACYAGMAIENSMLGAAHASANPLTKNKGITHGHAIALMLPKIVRYNSSHVGNAYLDLCNVANIKINSCPGETLAKRLEEMISFAQLPTKLSSYSITKSDLDTFAHEATCEWTAQFNPRPLTKDNFVNLYEMAL